MATCARAICSLGLTEGFRSPDTEKGALQLSTQAQWLGRPLVLVVDDDLLIRRALELNLRRLGCDVLQAADGNQALKVAAESRPAVIFLDLRMPGLDGHAVMRRLPAMGSQASVIVMSGHGDMDDVIDAVRNGAIDYLKKPWKTTDLAAALGRAVELHQAFNRLASDRFLTRPGLTGHDAGAPSVAGSHPWTPAFMAAAPATLRSLRAMAAEASPAIESIVNAVSPDHRLVRALLILANAGSRSPATFVQDLDSAVQRLGSVQVHAVAETLAMRDICQARVPALRTMQERIWRFSVAKAISMRAIAEVTGPEITLDPDRCCVSGLLMDVGATFLLWRLGDESVSPVAPAADAVHSLIKTNHARLGQGLISAWGLPADLAGLAAIHHAEIPPLSNEPFWCVAVLAGTMAARLVEFDDPTWTQPPRAELIDRCCHQLGIGETVVRRLCVDLITDLNEARNALTQGGS